MPHTEPASGTASIQSVAVAFEILEELSRSPEAVGVTELARRLGQTKARVHRHLTNLRQLGFVSQDSSSDRYQLGWKIYRLGMSVAENFGLRRLARPHLQQLVDTTGETALLAMPAGREVIVVDAAQSQRANIVITVRPGTTIPAVTSALGRAIVAFLPDSHQQELLGGPIHPLTERTVTDPNRLQTQLQEARRDRYAVAVAERLMGISALAAPIFDDHRQVVGSVGLITSQSVITDPPSRTHVEAVQSAAAAITAELHGDFWRRPQS